MEKGDFRRERLAELGIDRLQRPPERAWSARTRRMQDRWHRYTAGGWERMFFIGASVVAIIVAVIGIVALASGGGGDDNSSAAAQTRPTEAASATGNATPTAITIGVPDIPTNLPTQTPLPEPTEEDTEDRTNCDEIRGTPYRSNEERAWFGKNCGASVTNPPVRPPATGSTPVPPPPTAPPPPTSPPQGLTTGEVISLGAAWLSNSGPKAYTINSSACSTVQIGDHSIVNCTGHLTGCQGAACQRDLQACVYADRRVVAASSC